MGRSIRIPGHYVRIFAHQEVRRRAEADEALKVLRDPKATRQQRRQAEKVLMRRIGKQKGIAWQEARAMVDARVKGQRDER